MSKSIDQHVLDENSSTVIHRQTSSNKKIKRSRRKHSKKCIYKVKKSSISLLQAELVPANDTAMDKLEIVAHVNEETSRADGFQVQSIDVSIQPRDEDLENIAPLASQSYDGTETNNTGSELEDESEMVAPAKMRRLSSGVSANKKQKKREFLTESFFSKKIQIHDLGKRKRNYEFDPYL
jgi:hypothetical protein